MIRTLARQGPCVTVRMTILTCFPDSPNTAPPAHRLDESSERLRRDRVRERETSEFFEIFRSEISVRIERQYLRLDGLERRRRVERAEK